MSVNEQAIEIFKNELFRRRKTQRWLARRMGVSDSCLTVFFNGRKTLPASRLEQIAGILNLNLQLRSM